MLVSLHIENIAVIKCADVDFDAGFTAMTGETGAGKSILIDSINFLLGAKANRDLLRSGEDRALVSAMFCGFSEETVDLLSENDVLPDEDGNLLISRTLSRDGRTQCKINGCAVTSSVIKTIAPALIQLHGQNDTLQLLDNENYLTLLDKFAKDRALLGEYRAQYHRMRECREILNRLLDENEHRDKLEKELKYDYQVLTSAKLKIGEEDELKNKRAVLQNAEKISKQTSFVYRALKDAEKGNVLFLMDKCEGALLQLSEVLPQAKEYAARLSELRFDIEDIADAVYDFSERVGADPTAELDAVETRLHLYDRLMRHYDTDAQGLLELLAKTKEKLEALADFDSEIAAARDNFKSAEDALRVLADKLTAARRAAAAKLAPEICAELAFLDMPSVKFDVAFSPVDFCENGADAVTFLISANAGEAPKPISKIASGGELSRIMLAIKTVFADMFSVGTVIYDEIDTGVSGKTARKIGIKLKKSASATQTICVTHSAQIASLADTHLLIEKQSDGIRTETRVRVLDGEDRVSEIARILGGVTVTGNMLASARELINETI